MTAKKFNEFILEKDAIKGGVADNMGPEDLAKLHGVDIAVIHNALEIGQEHELEHTDDETLAYEIALDHVHDDPFYYDKLLKMDEGKVKVFIDKLLRKMVDGGMGNAYNPKMRAEIRERIEAIVKETMEKYDYIVEANDHEVGMAQGQLKAIISAASSLQNKIGTEEIDLPGWIQDHISQSYNFIKQANDNYHELDEAAGVFRTYNELVGYEYKEFENAFKKLNKDNVITYDKKDDVSYGSRKGSSEAFWKYFHDEGKIYHSERDRDVLGLINAFNMVKRNHPWS